MYFKVILVYFMLHGVTSFLFQSSKERFPPRQSNSGLLDLVSPPTRDLTKTVIPTRRRIPKYMLKLYEELTTDDGQLKREMPYNVNAIRGIYPNHINKRTTSSMDIFYDIGYLRGKFAARRDEIHIFMEYPPDTDEDIFKPYVVKIHDKYTKLLIRKYKVPAFNYGWQVLSLSGWTKRWVDKPHTNHGIRITVYRGRRGKLALNNPFIGYPPDKDPYLILFGDDSTENLSTWRFLSGFPLNSLAHSNMTTSHLSRHRRMTSRRYHVTSLDGYLPQCRARIETVKLKGRSIDKQHIIVQPESYKKVRCNEVCLTVTRKSGMVRQRYCCVASKTTSMGFLVTEPSHNAITFTTVNNITDGCAWEIE